MTISVEAWAPAGALALQVIDLLDDGIVVVRIRDFGIELANRVARAVLRRFGGGRRLPWPMIAAIQQLAETDDPAVEVAVPGDASIELSLSALGASSVVIVLRRGQLGEHALRDVLEQRFGLSPRECEVVSHIRAGLRNQQIAERMAVSLGTVKNYASRVFSALHVTSRTELIATIGRQISQSPEAARSALGRVSRAAGS